MDPASREAMLESEGVVLVETLGESRFEEVRTQIELCRQNHVPVLGCVIIR